MMRQRQTGFSLIEIIAAFLIFAIGFGVLLQILTMSLRMADRSQEYTQATLWAESRLDAVGVGTPLQAGNWSGSFQDQYHWTMQVRQIQPPGVAGGVDENLPIELYKVDLVVSWGPPGREYHARFATLRAVNANENKFAPLGGR